VRTYKPCKKEFNEVQIGLQEAYGYSRCENEYFRETNLRRRKAFVVGDVRPANQSRADTLTAGEI
jgi:hypothetical protein